MGECGRSFQEHGRVAILYYVYFMTKSPIYRCRPAEVLNDATAVLFLHHTLERKLRAHPLPRIILHLGPLPHQPNPSSQANSARLTLQADYGSLDSPII